MRTLVRNEMIRSANLNYDEAFEEVIAQSCESFLRDIHMSEKSEQLYNTNPTLWERIKSALERIVKQVREAYANVKPQSTEAKIVEQMKDAIEPAYDMFIKGVKNAAQNLRNMEKAADEGGVKLQARYSESSDILNDFNIAENKMSDYIYVQRNVYNTLLKDGFFDKSETVGSNIRKYRTDINAETGMLIETGRRGIKETFNFNNYGRLSKQLKLQKLAVIRSLPEIIQNGHTIADDVANYHNDESGVGFAYIQANIEVNGDQITVKVAVRKSPQRNSFWVHSIESKEKSTELDPSGATPDLGYKSLSAENNVPQSTDKVKRQSRDSDYLSAVERGDMQTAQRMADEAAKAAGYTIKAYHGTYENFNVFDITKSRSYDLTPGYDLSGFYFSENSEESDSYGDSREYYLSLSNPYEGNEYMLAKKLGSYKAAFDYLVSEGYDGMVVDDMGEGFNEYLVFSSEQIKSADPVTYDDSGDVIPLSQRFDTTKTDIRLLNKALNRSDKNKTVKQGMRDSTAKLPSEVPMLL